VHATIASVCVYCGSRKGARPAYVAAAEELGAYLASAGIRLIYGGGAVGLMGVVAESVLENGGRVTGIIPRFLDDAEVGKRDVTDLIQTETMHERKARMAELSDGFVVLPGGLGTLDETFEILTWKQLRLHAKPIVLINTDGYWDLFVHLIERQVEEGFVDRAYLGLFRVVDTVSEVIPALMEAAPRGDAPPERLDRA
jgi:uncharacterized protein (TIGR00730 family)